MSSPTAPPPSQGLQSNALILSPSDPFDLLGEIVLNEGATLHELKAALHGAFSSAVPSQHERFRIREKLAAKLTRVFRGDTTLKGNSTPGTLKDWKILVVEEIDDFGTPTNDNGDVASATTTSNDAQLTGADVPSSSAVDTAASGVAASSDVRQSKSGGEDLTSSDVLLYLARWHPTHRRLDEPKEVIVRQEMKLMDLIQWISRQAEKEGRTKKEDAPAPAEAKVVSSEAASGSAATSAGDAPSSAEVDSFLIPSDAIGVEKPLPYQLANPSHSLGSLKFNTDWVTPGTTLANGQVFKVRDGDLLVWCDQRENAVEQYRQFRDEDDLVGHDGRLGERGAQRELKIWSPQEQEEAAMREAIRQVEESERLAAAAASK